MRRSCKPVQPCYTCPLNLGDHCWLYTYPRGQWRGRRCPAFENEEVIRRFREWQKEPTVKTRRDLRRECFRRRKRSALYHDPVPPGGRDERKRFMRDGQ